MVILNLILALIILSSFEKNVSYDLKCPTSTHRNLRANSICLPNSTFIYACLFDRNKQKMTESCSQNPDYSLPGEKYIISGLRTTIDCAPNRYQPFPLYANVSGHCLFEKSKCSEDGQITFTIDSTKSDRPCMCDFENGFDYISKPSNICACIPSEEDCSCFKSLKVNDHVCSSTGNINSGSTGYSVDSSLKREKISNEETKLDFISDDRIPIYTLIVIAILIALIGGVFTLFDFQIGQGLLKVMNYYKFPIRSISNYDQQCQNPPVAELKKNERTASQRMLRDVQDNQPDTTTEADIHAVQKEPVVVRDLNITLTSSPNQRHRSSFDKTSSRKLFKSQPSRTSISSNESALSQKGRYSVKTNTVSSNDSDIQLVAAIDIGTTTSIYAYALSSDPNSIILNRPWDAGRGGLWTQKTPTCILLTRDFEPISIGCDAQNQYRNYIYGQESNDDDEEDVEDVKLKDCLFVDKFKMELYNQEFTDETKMKDVNGKEVDAIKVYSKMILKLKERLIHENSDVPADFIKWVLTVPAIWTEERRHFVQKCAQMAGINEDKLSIVIESEAASIYIHKMIHERKLITSVEEMPSKYLVVDIGGGTTDITVHGLKDGKLKKLIQPSGSDNGGAKVAHLLQDHFARLVGYSVHNKLKSNVTYMDILEQFEIVITSASYSTSNKLPCKIPLSALDAICDAVLKKSFSSILELSSRGLSKEVSLTKDRLRFDKNLIDTLISIVAVGIVSDIKHVLQQLQPNEISTFIVVGGFSNSPKIKQILTNEFRNVTILFLPNDAELAVVKGAVLFGINPDMILK